MQGMVNENKELLEATRQVHEAIGGLEETFRQLAPVIRDATTSREDFLDAAEKRVHTWRKIVLSAILKRDRSQLENIHYEIKSAHKHAIKELIRRKVGKLEDYTLPNLFLDYDTELLKLQKIQIEATRLQDTLDEAPLEEIQEKVQEFLKQVEETTSRFRHKQRRRAVLILGPSIPTMIIVYFQILDGLNKYWNLTKSASGSAAVILAMVFFLAFYILGIWMLAYRRMRRFKKEYHGLVVVITITLLSLFYTISRISFIEAQGGAGFSDTSFLIGIIVSVLGTIGFFYLISRLKRKEHAVWGPILLTK